MKEVFVCDACALIAFLDDEQGADITEKILRKAEIGKCKIYINKLNLLEIYYGVFRKFGQVKAEEVLGKITVLPMKIIEKISDKVFKETGRIKAIYKVSLADSIALAEAKTKKAKLLTADHHEFDAIEAHEDINFYWIR